MVEVPENWFEITLSFRLHDFCSTQISFMIPAFRLNVTLIKLLFK